MHTWNRKEWSYHTSWLYVFCDWSPSAWCVCVFPCFKKTCWGSFRYLTEKGGPCLSAVTHPPHECTAHKQTTPLTATLQRHRICRGEPLMETAGEVYNEQQYGDTSHLIAYISINVQYIIIFDIQRALNDTATIVYLIDAENLYECFSFLFRNNVRSTALGHTNNNNTCSWESYYKLHLHILLLSPTKWSLSIFPFRSLSTSQIFFKSNLARVSLYHSILR